MSLTYVGGSRWELVGEDGSRWEYVGVGVGPPGPKVSLARVSPKGEHMTSTRLDVPKGLADYRSL